MKKLLALCLSVVMAFSIVACGETQVESVTSDNSETVQTESKEDKVDPTPEIKIEDPETAPNLAEDLIYLTKEIDEIFYNPFFTNETYIKLTEELCVNLDAIRNDLEKGDLNSAINLALNDEWANTMVNFAKEKIPFEEGTVYNFWTMHNGEIVRFGINKRAPLGKDDYSILQIDWRSENGKAFWILLGKSIYGVDVLEVRIGEGNTKDFILNGKFSMVSAEDGDISDFAYKFSGNAVNGFVDGTVTEEYGPSSYFGESSIHIEFENGIYKSCDDDMIASALEGNTTPQRPYDVFREY